MSDNVMMTLIGLAWITICVVCGNLPETIKGKKKKEHGPIELKGFKVLTQKELGGRISAVLLEDGTDIMYHYVEIDGRIEVLEAFRNSNNTLRTFDDDLYKYD